MIWAAVAKAIVIEVYLQMAASAATPLLPAATVQKLELVPAAELVQLSADQPVQTQYGPYNSEVDLMPVEITDNVMTVTLRYRSQPDHRLRTRYPIAEVSYSDDVTLEQYKVIQDQADSWQASPKNSAGNHITINVHDDAAIAWFKFPAPPPQTETISIHIPGVDSFTRVTVER
ncbi:MAG: hypothetical protein ACFB4I_21040 [Cyanophyceae cyanobacterium]